MNTVGSQNTAVGNLALSRNSGGHLNTATGALALALNTIGVANTALGFQALQLNTTASGNTAVGSQALQVNETGERNSAIGHTALFSNESGNDNTASGNFVLWLNTTGDLNTGSGSDALFSNTTGSTNSAYGANSLRSNTSGTKNTASGVGSLRNNSTGVRNVAIGYQAGFAITGSDNIVIGGGNQGKSVENGTIRIGTGAHQKKAFMAGIRGAKTGSSNASAVFVDENGQLGTIKSSSRYKEDIRPMGDVSERLFALRPVTFRYTETDEDGGTPVQFGLVAEEVAEAFPELVIYDENGNPESVSYHVLATLLVNEFQKAHATAQVQAAKIASLEQRLAEISAVMERLDHQRMVVEAR